MAFVGSLHPSSMDPFPVLVIKQGNAIQASLIIIQRVLII